MLHLIECFANSFRSFEMTPLSMMCVVPNSIPLYMYVFIFLGHLTSNRRNLKLGFV